LADLGIGDWFGGLLFSAGQQANEAVQDQLSALSFSRSVFFFYVTAHISLRFRFLLTFTFGSPAWQLFLVLDL
jgi:hypothetical protein